MPSTVCQRVDDHVSGIPSCPLCLDTLGRCGGPSTLPCGHNGCRDCFQLLFSNRDPRCPLCRRSLPAGLLLEVNHELRELIELLAATPARNPGSCSTGAGDAADEWEALPDGLAAAMSYAGEMRQQQQQQLQEGQLRSQQEAGGALRHSAFSSTWSHSLPLAAAAHQDLLTLEPPQWLPDSYAGSCGGCHQLFIPLRRLRHHCRMCGRIFCNSCCHKKMLLPPKYIHRDPQKVCELCSTLLRPLQSFLAGTQAAAVQPPVQDCVDPVSLRSWLNSPWSSSLEGDIFKVSNILQTFTQAFRLRPEEGLPGTVLQGCRALVLLSSIKLGVAWSCSMGTGVVISRGGDDAGWSAPCAVACCGMGWGLQVGGELTDVLLVLRDEAQLAACCSGARVRLEGNLGLAVGLAGRSANASVLLGTRGASAPIYSYSCSKGAFIGAALEGSVLMVRPAVNEKFYGYSVSAQQLLMEPGSVPQPLAASLLYNALHALGRKYELGAPSPVAVPRLLQAAAHQLSAEVTQQRQQQPLSRMQHQPPASLPGSTRRLSSEEASESGRLLRWQQGAQAAPPPFPIHTLTPTAPVLASLASSSSAGPPAGTERGAGEGGSSRAEGGEGASGSELRQLQEVHGRPAAFVYAGYFPRPPAAGDQSDLAPSAPVNPSGAAARC